MDQVRRVLAIIQKQLGQLGSSQKLLIGSLAVLVAMTMFLVAQYAGTPDMVALIPSGTPEDQQRAGEQLTQSGIPYSNVGGRVMVSRERQFPALAALQRAQALPADKRLLMDDLVQTQSWMMSNRQLDQMRNTALCNTLARIIENFPGITGASVMIDSPEAKGIGAAFRKPTASVNVFTRAGAALDQPTVDALADLVAGSTAGLQAADIAIVDGTNRRRYRANAVEDFYAGTYLEQAAKVEERVQEKIAEHLGRFIPDVIVSVHAIVDGAKRESRTDAVLPRNEGTLSLPIRESVSAQTTTEASRSAVPGIGANIEMDINSGGGSGASQSDEKSETEFSNHVGRKTVVEQDSRGKPTRINVAVSIPVDYVAQVAARRRGRPVAAGGAGGAGDADVEPTDEEIRQVWDGDAGVRREIERMVTPLIETEVAAGGATSAGTVVVSMIPVALTAAGGAPGVGRFGGASGGGGGAFSGVSALTESGLFKQLFLGGLAALAVGMMLLMVRRAGKAGAVPTAEELVGIPPALDAGSDLVGEADETDTAMTGIEIDADSLKTTKMLEEVGDLVKSNPSAAASVFNRWLTVES